MRRVLLATAGTAVIVGVIGGLARDARALSPTIARCLLIGLGIFLVIEWGAHLIGSRMWGPRAMRTDRAAWAALSSAGIWIAMLAIVPFVANLFGFGPDRVTGMLLMCIAAASGLAVRLWFLREIYEMDFERAATLWAMSRGAAMAIGLGMLFVYVVFDAAVPAPMLSLHP